MNMIIDKNNKTDEMAQRTDKKSVLQIFIENKHIGGYTDLIELEKSGVLNCLLGIPEKDYSKKDWELVIIGAGSAGMNAARYAARKGIDLLLISADMDGQVVDTEDIGNYIGKKDTNGALLMNDFWEHLEQYNISSVIGEEVEEIILVRKHIIKTDSGKEYKSKAMIIASGTKKRRLGMKQKYVLKVDLVDIKEANTVFKIQIIQGKLIYNNNNLAEVQQQMGIIGGLISWPTVYRKTVLHPKLQFLIRESVVIQ